jgi:hypothetical protein
MYNSVENYWHNNDGTQGIPTLFRLRGYLSSTGSLSSTTRFPSGTDAIGIFFDGNLNPAFISSYGTQDPFRLVR